MIYGTEKGLVAKLKAWELIITHPEVQKAADEFKNSDDYRLRLMAAKVAKAEEEVERKKAKEEFEAKMAFYDARLEELLGKKPEEPKPVAHTPEAPRNGRRSALNFNHR
jgi:hypothetical protein